MKMTRSVIGAHLPTEVFPTNLICLKKPIRCDRGYVIYQFTSDLFSLFHIPRPEMAPTNLIAIPKYHADSEAAHLRVQEATLHQRIQEEDYALPPLHTWDDDPFLSPLPTQVNLTWSEEMERLWKHAEEQLGWNGQEFLKK